MRVDLGVGRYFLILRKCFVMLVNLHVGGYVLVGKRMLCGDGGMSIECIFLRFVLHYLDFIFSRKM